MSITNNGTISGGLAGDGTTRAYAIRFTGGTNRLELHAGSNITGRVGSIFTHTVDTLALGGSTDHGFDLSQIGASAQYAEFDILQKTGSSKWTLAGTTNAALQTMAWQLDEGAVVLGDPAVNDGIAPLAVASLAWTGGSAIDFQLGATAAASDAITLTGALSKVGSGSYRFHFSDGAAAPTCGTAYPLIQAGSISSFAASDFSFDYSGSHPGFGGSFSIIDDDVVFTLCRQNLSFGTPPTVLYGGTGTVMATTTAVPSSSYPITFSTTSTDCSVTSEGEVTGINAGTANCQITATQAGDASYEAATETQTLSIGKASQAALTATASPAGVTLGGISTLGTTGGSGTGAVSYAVTAGDTFCTVNGSTLTGTAVGTCTVTATRAADANHEQATATVDVAVRALVPVPTLSAWLLGLLGTMLAAIGLARSRHARG